MHTPTISRSAPAAYSRACRASADVTLAICSIPSHTETRRPEADAAAGVLDADLVVLNDKPRRVEDIPIHELARRMDQVIGDVRPDLVITHSANDLHWDHGLVNRPTVSALRRTPRDLLAYLSSPEMNAQSRSFGTALPISPASSRPARRDRVSQEPKCANHIRVLPKLDLDSSRDLARAMGRISGFSDAEVFETLRVRV